MATSLASMPLATMPLAGPEQRCGAPSGSVALRLALSFLLLSTTVLQSVGVNFGSYSLNIAILGMYGCLVVAGFSGMLELSHRRLVLYVTCITAALASLIVNANLARADRSSFASFLLLALMYLPFVFTLRGPSASGSSLSSGAPDGRWVLRHFSNIALFCAGAGILQFFLQFVTKASWLFDFSAYLPSVLRGPSGFNTVIPVGSLFKSNGFFFREPSGFSFIMAFALVCEWVLYKRPARIACFALALLLTYSGTGLLALLVAVTFPLGRKTLPRLGLLAIAGGAAVFFLGDTLNLSFTLGRIEEFGAERSSAYIRYIAPFRVILDTAGSEPWALWLGQGPGAIFRQSLPYEFHDPTWAKLVVEYGLIGFALFLALYLAPLGQSGLPAQVRITLFFYWLAMGGHLLSPEVNFMTLALAGLLPSQLGVGAESQLAAELPSGHLTLGNA